MDVAHETFSPDLLSIYDIFNLEMLKHSYGGDLTYTIQLVQQSTNFQPKFMARLLE